MPQVETSEPAGMCGHHFKDGVEALFTQIEKAPSEVVKVLLKEIIPCFGPLNILQSDNKPASVSSITQQVSKTLN